MPHKQESLLDPEILKISSCFAKRNFFQKKRSKAKYVLVVVILGQRSEEEQTETEKVDKRI